MSETQAETKVRNKGQFQKGNPGGPGNPHARQVARIRATLLAALEPETLYQIVCQLIDRAVRGNLEAIKILLAYAVGRPGKSDNLVELLTAHYPPIDAEPNDQTPPPRQQTAQTAASDAPGNPSGANRQQTAQTVAPPVGQVADRPKAPADIAPATPDRLAMLATETDRQQTAQTAEVRRQQTAQTAPSARKRRQQTAISARMLTSALTNGRQQTAPTAPDPLELMSLIQDVLESDASPFAVEPANDISLVR